MWTAIIEGLQLAGLLFKYWTTSKAHEEEKKRALLAYEEAREKFTGGLPASFYWQSQKQKEELKKEKEK